MYGQIVELISLNRRYLFPIAVGIVWVIGRGIFFLQSKEWIRQRLPSTDERPLIEKIQTYISIDKDRFNIFVLFTLIVWSIPGIVDILISVLPLPPGQTTIFSYTFLSLSLVTISMTFVSIENIFKRIDQDISIKKQLDLINNNFTEYINESDIDEGFIIELYDLVTDLHQKEEDKNIPSQIESLNDQLESIKNNEFTELQNSVEEDQTITNEIETKVENLGDKLEIIENNSEKTKENASNIEEQIERIDDFAQRLGAQIGPMESMVDDISKATEEIKESKTQLHTDIDDLTDDTESLTETTNQFRSEREELTQIQHRLEHILQEPFSSEHFYKKSLKSLIQQSTQPEYRITDTHTIDVEWVIEIDTLPETNTLTVAIETIDVHDQYKSFLESEEPHLEDDTATQICKEIESQLQSLLNRCRNDGTESADLILAYFETENLYHFATRILTQSDALNKTTQLEEYADRGLNIVSPSILKTQLQSLEQEARAWYWYRSAMEAKQDLIEIEEDVEEFYTDVEEVRNNVKSVNEILGK